jgi:threonine dehydratase
MTNSMTPTLRDIEAAALVVYREFAATPQYRWALLSETGHHLLGQA